MKNIFKISIYALLVLQIVSCTNEITSTATVAANNFNSRVDAGVVSPANLSSTTLTDKFTSITWDNADNGVPSVSTYSIIISDKDADPNFQNPIEYTGAGIDVSVNVRKAALTVKEMNELINQLPSFKCSEMNIELRVKSILGIDKSSQFYQYSNPIIFKVTAYSLSNSILSFSRSASTASTAVRLSSSSNTNIDNFQGYHYLEAGSYKFYRPDACKSFANATEFGGVSGSLSSTGTAINIATAGHYFVKADLVANTYSISEFTNMAIYGRATRAAAFGFTNNVPLTYNALNKTWTATLNLINGQTFRFRTVKWPGGALQSPTGTVVQPAPDFIPSAGATVISILGLAPVSNGLIENATLLGDLKAPGTINGSENTKYLITVNVSNPRNYTYSLTPQ